MTNSSDNPPDLDYTDTLWQAADKLRGTVDTTGHPVCLWFLTRDKSGTNPTRKRENWRDRQGEPLFIDAGKLGTMQTRTLRVLTDGEFAALVVEPKAKVGTAPVGLSVAGRRAGRRRMSQRRKDGKIRPATSIRNWSTP